MSLFFQGIDSPALHRNPAGFLCPGFHNRSRLGPVAVLSLAGVLFLQISLVGCGMAAAPQPPSLQLPKQISDLTAVRSGNQVHLTWNTPTENTDRLKLKGMVEIRICRQQGAAACQTAGTVSVAPGKPAQYTDVLPPSFTTGPIQSLTYLAFGLNRRGRTAGPSNAAIVLAGEAPPSVEDLSAQVVEHGVILRWRPVANLPPGTSVQIDRTLVTPAAPAKTAKSKGLNPLPPATEQVMQTLRVTPVPAGNKETVDQKSILVDPGIALDTHVVFGRQYRYTASRVVQQQVGQQTLPLASSPSQPVLVNTVDTFPPSPPARLVAVPVSAAMNNGPAEVDLSWSANTEPDFAQYRVYRHDIASQAPMERIVPSAATGSNPESIVAPAFRDMQVQPGHTYGYAVTAVDAAGNESARSPEVTVTVPES